MDLVLANRRYAPLPAYEEETLISCSCLTAVARCEANPMWSESDSSGRVPGSATKKVGSLFRFSTWPAAYGSLVVCPALPEARARMLRCTCLAP